MEGPMPWLFPAWLTASKLLTVLCRTEHLLPLQCPVGVLTPGRLSKAFWPSGCHSRLPASPVQF